MIDCIACIHAWVSWQLNIGFLKIVTVSNEEANLGTMKEITSQTD